jgi:hypothetical protein
MVSVDYARIKRLQLPEERDTFPTWTVVVILIVIVLLFKRYKDVSSNSESRELSSLHQTTDDS